MGQYIEAMPRFSLVFETLVFPQSCDQGHVAGEGEGDRDLLELSWAILESPVPPAVPINTTTTTKGALELTRGSITGGNAPGNRLSGGVNVEIVSTEAK